MFFLRNMYCDCCSADILCPRDPDNIEDYIITVSYSNQDQDHNMERVFHKYCFHNYIVGDDRFKKISNSNIWNIPACYVCKCDLFKAEGDFHIYSIVAYRKKNMKFNDMGESYTGEPKFALDFCKECFEAMTGKDFFNTYKYKKGRYK